MSDPITKQRLKNYIALKMENDHQLERLARMKSKEQFPAMREHDESKHTGGASDRMANAILNRMNYEAKIIPIIERNIAEMELIENAVNSLSDPMERELLRLRYMSGEDCRHMTWPDVAVLMYGADDENALRSVYRLHGRALKNINQVRVYD